MSEEKTARERLVCIVEGMDDPDYDRSEYPLHISSDDENGEADH